MDRIVKALDFANPVGCWPYIRGAERSDGFSAFHAGVFLKPSATKSLPWVLNDTLQPPTSTGHKSQRQSAIRMQAMVKLCLAIDSVLNTRGQRALMAHDPRALSRSRQLHNTIRSQSHHAIDYGRLQIHPLPATELEDVTRILRFGNLGSDLCSHWPRSIREASSRFERQQCIIYQHHGTRRQDQTMEQQATPRLLLPSDTWDHSTNEHWGYGLLQCIGTALLGNQTG